MMRLRTTFAPALAAAMLLAAAPAFTQPASSPWPMFQHDARRTGQGQFNGPPVVALMWSYETGNYLNYSPAVDADGMIYEGSADNVLYAFASPGTLWWSYCTGGDSYSSPAVDVNGTVYIGFKDNYLYAFSSGGILAWSYYAPPPLTTSSPAIDPSGRIYVGAHDNVLYVLNSNGTLSWSHCAGDDIASPVFGSGGEVYAPSLDANVHVLDSTGAFSWSYACPVAWHPFCAGPDGALYLPYYGLSSISSTGSLRWSYALASTTYYSALDNAGSIYTAAADNRIYALLSTGTLSWSYLYDDDVPQPLSIDITGNVYLGTGLFGASGKKLYAMSSTGALLWTFQAGGGISSAPVLNADRRVCFGSSDHRLYVLYDIVPTPTPTWDPSTPTHTPTPTSSITLTPTVTPTITAIPPTQTPPEEGLYYDKTCTLRIGDAPEGGSAVFDAYCEGGTNAAGRWKSDVYLDHGDGSSTALGLAVAAYEGRPDGQYISATWDCPGANLSPDDALEIFEQIEIDGCPETSVVKTFKTDPMGLTRLESGTWTFTRFLRWNGPYGEPPITTAQLNFGGTYATRVTGIVGWSPEVKVSFRPETKACPAGFQKDSGQGCTHRGFYLFGWLP